MNLSVWKIVCKYDATLYEGLEHAWILGSLEPVSLGLVLSQKIIECLTFFFYPSVLVTSTTTTNKPANNQSDNFHLKRLTSV